MEIEEKIKIAEESLKNHLNKYPGHEAVIEEMMDVVGGNIESSRDRFDYYANGFKAKSALNEINTSGETYVYAAFAEHPFKTARAR